MSGCRRALFLGSFQSVVPGALSFRWVSRIDLGLAFRRVMRGFVVWAGGVWGFGECRG